MLRLVFCVALLSLASAELPAASPLDGRIVGGQEVPITAYPHQISLRYKSCEACAFAHLCGGSILDAWHIVTAAHCVYRRNETNFAIVAGSDTRNGADGIIVLAESVILHEYYDSATYDYDIAVVALTIPLPIDNYTIRPVQMATEQSPSGAIATVTGWGATSEGGVSASKLQAVTVPVITNDACNDKYGEGRITSNMMCAGYTDGGKDACQGDSGGPLLVGGKLAGVVSWGIGCARPEYPGVYANVPTLKKWVDDVLSGVVPTPTPTDTTPTDTTPTDTTPTVSPTPPSDLKYDFY